MISRRWCFWQIMISIIITTVFTSAHASISQGPYLGLEAGATNQTINFNPENFNLNTQGVNIVSSSIGMSIRFNLGYSIDKYNSFELGTTYSFGFSHSYPNNNGELNEALWSEDLSYLLSIPTVIENLSFFGRGGVGYDWNSPGCGCQQSLSVNDFTDVIGAGIKYKLSSQSVMRIEWIANGLFFPVNISYGASNMGLLTNNNFELGINYYF